MLNSYLKLKKRFINKGKRFSTFFSQKLSNKMHLKYSAPKLGYNNVGCNIYHCFSNGLNTYLSSFRIMLEILSLTSAENPIMKVYTNNYC